jgi:hypothetical protein
MNLFLFNTCQLPKSIIWTWFQWEKTITQNKSSPHPSPPYPRKSTGCPLITRVTMFLFASCNIPYISSYQIYSFTIFVRTNEHATQSTFRNALDDCHQIHGHSCNKRTTIWFSGG